MYNGAFFGKKSSIVLTAFPLMKTSLEIKDSTFAKCPQNVFDALKSGQNKKSYIFHWYPRNLCETI